MKLPLFIARRYLNISKGYNFIHLIGLISLLSIALSTMALIIALSVFNGLEGLMKSLYSSFNPDLKICLIEGKTFQNNKEITKNISSIKGVSKVVKTLEDNALLRYKGKHMIAKIKGVSSNFLLNNQLANHIVLGKFSLSENRNYLGIIGRGIRYNLRINITDNFYSLKIFYPKKISSGILDNSNMYRSKAINISGVFSLEREIDSKYMITPLKFMRKLTGKKNELSALEVIIKNGFNINKIKKQIINILPPKFKVLDLNEQTEGLINAMKMEKKILAIIFLVIIMVTSLNLFFVLSMLVVNKNRDIAILYTLGAKPSQVRMIFILEGMLIATLGVIVGSILALAFCSIQEKFGIISLGVESSIIDHYPIKKEFKDFVYAIGSVLILSFLASLKPADVASKYSVTGSIID